MLATHPALRRRNYAELVMGMRPAAFWLLMDGRSETGVGDGVFGGAARTVLDPPITRGVGVAMGCNGDGYLDAGLVTSSADNWTLFAWVRGETDSAQRIVLGNGSLTQGYSVGIFNTTRIAVYRGESSGVSIVDQWIGGATALLNGAWHHLALTYSGGATLRYYLDGVLTKTGSMSPTTPSGSSAVGVAAGGGGRYWHGDIYAPSIFGRAIDADEVRALYLGGVNGTL